MLLDTHLRAKGLTDQEFANMVGCERSYVTKLRNGLYYPSFPLTLRIVSATAGQVTAVDLYEAHKAKLAPKGRKGNGGRRTA